MKGFLLAAGHGTRLRPLTDSVPKCLLPINGTPMLAIWLEVCRRFQIEEVLVNVHAHADQIRQFVRTHQHGVNVRVIEEPQLLGSAGTLRANAAWVNGEDCFWVLYADVLTRADLGEMLRVHRNRRPAATLGVCRVPNPDRCGIVKLNENDTVIEFVEKPARPATNLAFAGLMLATPSLLTRIPTRQPCDIGFDLLPNLVNTMHAYRISEYLIDIGNRETYERAQETWPGLAAREHIML